MDSIALSIPAEAGTQGPWARLLRLLHRCVPHQLLQDRHGFDAAQHHGAARPAAGFLDHGCKGGVALAAPVKLLGPLFAERRLLLLEDRESCRFDLGLDSHQIRDSIGFDNAECALQLQRAVWEEGFDLLVCCFHVDASIHGVAGAISAPKRTDCGWSTLSGDSRVRWPTDQLHLANSTSALDAHDKATGLRHHRRHCVGMICAPIILLTDELCLCFIRRMQLFRDHEQP
mmetsp:Transcript_932/g.2180  ORF Transcript_932/g.2180 Transcript_932/m.2180 type:complete len:230 (+) Transcript_932:3377-4066(+)